MQKAINNINQFILVNLLLTTLVSDGISKILLVAKYDFHRIGLFLKGLILVFFTIQTVFYIQKSQSKIFKYLLALISLLLISQIIMLFYDNLGHQDILSNVFTLATYSYLPILAITFFNSKSQEKILRYNIKVFKIAAIIISLMVVLNLVLGLDIFKSYPFSGRFGNNGLLLTASTASYFYVFIILTLYYEYIKLKSLKSLLGLILVTFVSILVGTKTIWFFIIALSTIHFCFVISKPYRYFFRALLIVIFALTIFFWKPIELFIVGLFNFGEEIYTKHGIISVLTSTRDLFLYDALAHIKEQGPIFNYLLGGINVMKHRVEFEFVNLFLFFGIGGSIIYILILKNIFVKNLSKLRLWFLVAVVLTAALAGGFFYSFMSSTLFFLTFMYLNHMDKTNNCKIIF